MTTESQTPRNYRIGLHAHGQTAIFDAVGLVCTLEAGSQSKRDADAAHIVGLERENARLREALVVALPLMDAWLNGDGTNIDMNEWDAVVMIARAALVQS